MGRIIRYTLAGTLGALIAWAFMEITHIFPMGMERLSYGRNFAIGMISGLCVGLLLGLADAVSCATTRDATRSVGIAAGVGAIGGVFGMNIGNTVFGWALWAAGGAGIYERHADANGALPPGAAPGILSFLLLLVGRGFGWAIIGMLIGLSQGIAKKSKPKIINGAWGGFIGGGIGGSVFETLVWISRAGALPIPPSLVGSTPVVLRFISYAITGAAIGLFLGFVEELTKKAWLIRLVGRNEGKEIEIYKPVTIIGRSEFVDIPVFSDPDVAEKHAAIVAQGQRYFIEDSGSYYGTHLNGQKITKREILQDGDLIEIGKTKFTYRDKATANLTPRSQSHSSVQIPTSSHVCPFCGAPKDANGNCDCSVASAPSQPQAAPDMGQTVQQQMTQPMAPPSSVQQQTMQTNGASGPKLTAIAGPFAGQVFPLKQGETLIGRESTKDVPLHMDNSVSRNHARIAEEVTCYVLYDTGSTNGTYVNGTKITRHQLTPGDVVQIGSTKFRFDQ